MGLVTALVMSMLDPSLVSFRRQRHNFWFLESIAPGCRCPRQNPVGAGVAR
jgi:hypothetical protein